VTIARAAKKINQQSRQMCRKCSEKATFQVKKLCKTSGLVRNRPVADLQVSHLAVFMPISERKGKTMVLELCIE
jgi:ribosomal protein L37E